MSQRKSVKRKRESVLRCLTNIGRSNPDHDSSLEGADEIPLSRRVRLEAALAPLNYDTWGEAYNGNFSQMNREPGKCSNLITTECWPDKELWNESSSSGRGTANDSRSLARNCQSSTHEKQPSESNVPVTKLSQIFCPIRKTQQKPLAKSKSSDFSCLTLPGKSLSAGISRELVEPTTSKFDAHPDLVPNTQNLISNAPRSNDCYRNSLVPLAQSSPLDDKRPKSVVPVVKSSSFESRNRILPLGPTAEPSHANDAGMLLDKFPKMSIQASSADNDEFLGSRTKKVSQGKEVRKRYKKTISKRVKGMRDSITAMRGSKYGSSDEGIDLDQKTRRRPLRSHADSGSSNSYSGESNEAASESDSLRANSGIKSRKTKRSFWSRAFSKSPKLASKTPRQVPTIAVLRGKNQDDLITFDNFDHDGAASNVPPVSGSGLIHNCSPTNLVQPNINLTPFVTATQSSSLAEVPSAVAFLSSATSRQIDPIQSLESVTNTNEQFALRDFNGSGSIVRDFYSPDYRNRRDRRLDLRWRTGRAYGNGFGDFGLRNLNSISASFTSDLDLFTRTATPWPTSGAHRSSNAAAYNLPTSCNDSDEEHGQDF